MRSLAQWSQCLGGMVIMLVLMGTASPVRDPSALHTVEGRGAILRQNQAAARQRALQASLRQALEQAVADLLVAKAQVAHLLALEKRVYQQAARFIRSYRVLWEYPDLPQKVYRLEVEAEVALEALRLEMRQLGLSPTGGTAPRVVLLLQAAPQIEPQFAGHVQRVLRQVLRDRFEAGRFLVVEPDPGTPWDGEEASALVVGRAAQADVVLLGRADVRRMHDGVAGMALHTVQATVRIRTWVAATGIQLGVEQAGATMDHTDVVLAGQRALEKAAAAVADRLVPDLEAY